MKWLVADWGGNKDHVFRAVLDGLANLGHTVDAIPRSDMDRRAELVSAITSGKYQGLLTWQRFYAMQHDLLEAIRQCDIKTLFMDYGFHPHYESVVFDTEGENGTSSWLRIWRGELDDRLGPRDYHDAEALMASEAARVRLLPAPQVLSLDRLRLPFVFVPLQRPGDAVVRFDSSLRDFGELFRKVCLLARDQLFVVCKTHPLDKDLDLGVPDTIPHTHLVLRQSFGAENEALCDYLLSRASLVVGVNSNMLFRALLFGTPVIATGRGWFTGSTTFAETDGLDRLTCLRVATPDHQAQLRYVALCLSRQLRFSELSDPAQLGNILERLAITQSAAGVLM